MTAAQTPLAAAITTTGQSSITVTDVLGFPASGAFTILIDSERLHVTAGAGTTAWTVTRGYDGTTAATHLVSATVTQVPSLVATAGAADADAYLTVAEADALAAADIGLEASAWLLGDEGVKEAVIRRATREVDGYLDTGWDRHDPAAQAVSGLIFPRSIDLDAADDPIIPRRVVLATYQQAIYVMRNHRELAAANIHRARTGDSEPASSFGVSATGGPDILCPMAAHYLSGFRRAPKATSRGTVRSLRVSTGFPGSV